MSTYLRNNRAGSSNPIVNIVTDTWDLDEQLAALLKWLRDNPNFDTENGDWIVDIGFEPRTSATVAGYTINIELMRMLVERDITLWLSDYLNERLNE